jgi:hypothetical protein
MNLKHNIMKSSNPKKSISNLENQKVDSDKIQGGGARPEPIKLTKDNGGTLEAPDNGAAGFGGPATSGNSKLNKKLGQTNKRSRF